MERNLVTDQLSVEQIVIGSIIQEPDFYHLVSGRINSEYFHSAEHRIIYSIIEAMAGEKMKIDRVTISYMASQSKRWPHTEDVTLKILTDLMDYSGTFTYFEQYIDLLEREFVKINLVKAARKVEDYVVTTEHPTQQIITRSLKKISDIKYTGTTPALTAHQHATSFLETYREAQNLDFSLTTQQTYFSDVDKLTNGFDRGALVILSARPSMGKTALALTLARNVAREGGTVYFYSLEMPSYQITQRLIATYGVDYTKIRENSPDVDSGIVQAVKDIESLNMTINDPSSIHVDQLVFECTLRAIDSPPDMIVVDYLQLLKGTGDSKNYQIGYVAEELKALAKKLNCPVVALSQLGRAVENRENKRPQSSDLRDSGEIEAHADYIIGLYRDEVYNPESDHKGFAELCCTKNRFGRIGSVFLETQLYFQRFVTATSQPEPINNNYKGKKRSKETPKYEEF